MQDIINDIKNLTDGNTSFVTATVVTTWGSGPRKVGAGMVVSQDDRIFGSVSGGCVEGDVIKAAGKVWDNGEKQVVHYGITDDEAWEIGLSCGGKIDILIEKIDLSKSDCWQQLTNLVSTNAGCVLTSSLSGSSNQQITQLTDNENERDPLIASALDAYKKRKSGIYEVKGKEYFHNVFPKKSQLIIVGAAHISSQLVELASMQNFETIVVDPRGLFTDKTDFRVHPDQSHKMWPGQLLESMELNSDVFTVLLTHDPKIDDQALHSLLRSDVSYIGALGSIRTHERRKSRLLEAGFTAIEIARIHAPAGVDINAKNPREIALSIVGELVKTRNQFL